ncbi:MAG: ADP-ribosylglycohydrolase family protein [Chloroflexi bacterium]|nr:ADP-ribosylglycohydrolase family protein [Chloroflexota bacterium]MCL5274828.1 ADP-ribosylglycohydrolase family protein [Chloroflexota bacterium]
MTKPDLYSRILGCMVGNSIGDAFGAVVEFFSAERMQKTIGSLWLDDFLPYSPDFPTDPYGVWQVGPPRGAGTDDTRNNQIFAECVIRNRGFINSQLLAIEYIERYRDVDQLPPAHQALAERHYRWAYDWSCAYLGMREMPPGEPTLPILQAGNTFPMLAGLISLAFAGLLYCGEPERAYLKAMELAYNDIGYAKDATAMLAAMISAALGGADASEMIRAGLETDPHHFGENRVMGQWIKRVLGVAGAAADDRALVQALARELNPRHVFDTVDILGVPVAALAFTGGDPVRSITIAANNRDLDAQGQLVRLRDVDCSAGIAGALVGALHGIKAFPPDWVRDTLAANKAVYGIDIERNAQRFYDVVYG